MATDPDPDPELVPGNEVPLGLRASGDEVPLGLVHQKLDLNTIVTLTHTKKGLFLHSADGHWSPLNAPARATSTATKMSSLKAKPLSLTLLPGPPLPMAVTVATGQKATAGRSGVRLDLSTAIQQGRFSEETVSLLRRKLSTLDDPASLRVFAGLPPGRSIDLGKLSRHVDELRGRLNQPLHLIIGPLAKK